MKNIFMIVLGGCVFFAYAWAEDVPTVVYGSAETKNGGQNVFVVEQPKNAVNPLGNPIVEPDNPVQVFGDAYTQNSKQPDQTMNYNDKDTVTQNNLGNDFENTLMEANGRVYDIQSYPKADFKAMENPSDPQTIYSPNVNN